jgi:hypothetical protein
MASLSRYVNAVSWDPVLDERPSDLCPLPARCRDGREACEQFAMFALYGGRKWGQETREPSTAIYARLFRGGTLTAA